MSNMFPFKKSEPRSFPGGQLFRASEKVFPELSGLAIQALELKVGSIREAHLHPNADQMDYCVSGKARVGIIGPEGHRQYLELEAGDISFVPQGFIHWIENIGPADLSFLVVLNHAEPQTIELSEILSGVPRDTLATTLGLSSDLLEALPEKTVTIAARQEVKEPVSAI